MAGHNKWSKIKHKKGREDARRSKVWTKLIREITVAAKLGGLDPAGNPRLRKALDDARAGNMPKDTIDRAVKRGDSDDDDANYEELVYEGYGPAGVALFIECTTDNRNRTSGDVGSVLRRGNGTLGKSGSVAYLFEKKGLFIFDKTPDEGTAPIEDGLLEIGLDHGAEDVLDDGKTFTVTSTPSDFNELREAFGLAGFPPIEANIAMMPQTTVKIEGNDARAVFRLIDALEDLDDVQNVWSNFDIDPDEFEKLAA